MTTNEKPRRQAGAGEAYSNDQFIEDYNTSDIESQFSQAMQDAGINYSGEIIADGDLHRFHIEGHRKGTRNGAYTLHSDGCPAGWFQDYTTGFSQKWRMSSSIGMYTSFRMKAEIEKAKLQRDAEQRQKHAEAANEACSIWSRSKPITRQSEHAYLVRKHIQPHSARLYKDELVIPICNESDELVSLQFISPEGKKRFLPGGQKKGCFATIGKQQTPRILICEGFATGVSLYEDTDQCVVIAFDAGNLLPVAKNIRELSPDTEIIICGDNDISGIGQAKASEAAKAIGSKASIPPILGLDWNDYLMRGNHNG